MYIHPGKYLLLREQKIYPNLTITKLDLSTNMDNIVQVYQQFLGVDCVLKKSPIDYLVLSILKRASVHWSDSEFSVCCKLFETSAVEWYRIILVRNITWRMSIDCKTSELLHMLVVIYIFSKHVFNYCYKKEVYMWCSNLWIFCVNWEAGCNSTVKCFHSLFPWREFCIWNILIISTCE